MLARIGALLLLMLFLVMPVTEMFHGHHSADNAEKVQYQGKYTRDSKVSTLHAKCKVCDFIHHHSGPVFLVTAPSLIFVYQTVKPVKWYFRLQSYSSYIHSCANKGPPVYC